MRLSRLLLVATLVAIPVYGALFVAYRAAEEDLDPDLVRTRAEIEANAALTGNGYYAYLGLGALGPQDAEAVGRRLIEWDRQNWRAILERRPTTPLESLGLTWRVWPDDWKTLVCHLPDTTGCVNRVLAGRPSLTALLDEMRPVLDDYRALLDYPVFRVPHVPTFEGFVPAEAFRIAKLHQAQIVLLAVDGRPSRAVEELQKGLALWRRMLAQTHVTMLDRKVAIAAAGIYAQTASELLRDGHFPVEEARRVAEFFGPLTGDERRMHGTLALEGAFVAQVADVDFFASREHPAGWTDHLGEFVVKSFYRRHWVANRNFREVMAFDVLDRMSAREFRAHLPDAARLVEQRVGRVGLVQYLFNGVGVYVQSSGSVPDNAKHIACAHDIDALLRLVALQARIVAAQVPDEGVAEFIAGTGAALFDPYTEAPMRWDRQAGILWYDATDPKFVAQLLPIRIRQRGA